MPFPVPMNRSICFLVVFRKDASVLPTLLRTSAFQSTGPRRLSGAGSFVFGSGKAAQGLDRGDEVIGAADCRRIFCQGITNAVLGSRHASQHAGQAPLVGASADEHCPMLGGHPEGGIAAEDVLLDPVLLDCRA